MAQKNIGTNWTRESRNAMNDNFDELYANYIGAGSSAAEAERLAREAVITANKAKEESGLAISEAQATQKQLDDIILALLTPGWNSFRLTGVSSARITLDARFYYL